MVSPRMVPSQVWTSSKLRWASAVRDGSVAAWLMEGAGRTQREGPLTWRGRGAGGERKHPAGETDHLDGGGDHADAGDPAATGAAGEAAEEDAGRGEQGRADHQDGEPGHDRPLVGAVEGEDVGGRFLEDLRVLEERAEGGEPGDGQ